VVQFVQPLQHGFFNQYTKRPDHQRGYPQHVPVRQLEIGEADPGDHGTHHEHGAMRKVDDIEQPKNDGQAQTQNGVKRAVDQAKQKLA
jgi:hypothetical protein